MLKRTVSVRRFFCVPTTYFWLRIKKNNFSLLTLLWGPDVQKDTFSRLSDLQFSSFFVCLTFGMLGEFSLHIFHLCQAPVVQLFASLIRNPWVVGLISARPHTFVEIDYETFSTVILLRQIQKMLLSVISQYICTEYLLVSNLVYICPGKHLTVST